MSYNISERPETGDEPAGWQIEFELGDKKPTVSIRKEDDHTLHLASNTDGYHWLHFWAAQEPNSEQLLKLTPDFERYKVRQSFAALGIGYEQEDRETCFLRTPENVTRETVEKIARFLEPRFAIREKFFPNG